MGVERRDIRHLRLRARSRDPLRRAVPEIGEAFRSASFPGLPRQGVVLVRHLDLGRFSGRISRHALARRLDALSFSLAVVPCRAGMAPPEAAALAWPDAVELVVAARILHARGASCWWSRRVLAAGSPSRSMPPAIRALAEREVGELPLAAARYALRLAELGEVSILVEDLRQMAVYWQQLPALSGPTHQRSLLRSTEGPGPARARDEGPRQPDLPDLSVAFGLAETLSATIRAALVPILELQDLPVAARLWMARAAVAIRRGPSMLPEIERAVRLRLAATRPEAAVLRPSRSPPSTKVDRVASKRLSWPEQRSGQARLEGGKAEPPVEMTRSGAEIRGSSLAVPIAAALPTRFGGLIQFINLIRAAGLEASEQEAGIALNLRLLHLFLERGTSADQLETVLPESAEEPPQFPTDLPAFLPEVSALHLAARRLVLARIAGAPGRRALLFARPLLTIGVVDAKRLKMLRAELPARLLPACRQGVTLTADSLAATLVPGLALLLQRLGYRLTGQGWRGMLLRRGWAEATATHLDLTLDLADVRIAERRAGLDRNPGWVGWLGFVVTLHFEAFETPGHPSLPQEAG